MKHSGTHNVTFNSCLAVNVDQHLLDWMAICHGLEVQELHILWLLLLLIHAEHDVVIPEIPMTHGLEERHILGAVGHHEGDLAHGSLLAVGQQPVNVGLGLTCNESHGNHVC